MIVLASTRAPRSRWLWALRLGLVLGTVALVMTIIEALSRRQTPGPESTGFLEPAPPDLPLPYVLRPGADVLFEGHRARIPATRVRITSQGLREDHEAALPKPHGAPRRILVLGDSFTFGYGVELEAAFVKRWQSRRPDLEVLNGGVPGYTTAHAVEWLLQRGLALEPDGVVVVLSANDFYEDGSDRLRDTPPATESGFRKWAEDKLRGKAKAAAKSGLELEPAEVKRRLTGALTRFLALCRERGLACQAVSLFDTPFTAELRALGLPTEPLVDADYKRDAARLVIPGDGHPTAEGHERLADLLARRLAAWPEATAAPAPAPSRP